MKEICGFKSSDGVFFEKEEDCILHEETLKLKVLEGKFNKFKDYIESHLINFEREYQRPFHITSTKDMIVKLLIQTLQTHKNEIKDLYESIEEQEDIIKRLSVTTKKPWWKVW